MDDTVPRKSKSLPKRGKKKLNTITVCPICATWAGCARLLASEPLGYSSEEEADEGKRGTLKWFQPKHRTDPSFLYFSIREMVLMSPSSQNL